jgi:hypothetical protein
LGWLGRPLIVKLAVSEAVSPSLSVTVTVRLWAPTVRPACVKLTAPAESALSVEKIPSTSEFHSIDRLASESSRSTTVAVKVTDSSSWMISPDVGELSAIVGALFWIVTESEAVEPVSLPS